MEAICDFGWDNPAAESRLWLTRANHHGPDFGADIRRASVRPRFGSVSCAAAGGRHFCRGHPCKRSSLPMDQASCGVQSQGMG
jgi:hypothetical protein